MRMRVCATPLCMRKGGVAQYAGFFPRADTFKVIRSEKDILKCKVILIQE